MTANTNPMAETCTQARRVVVTVTAYSGDEVSLINQTIEKCDTEEELCYKYFQFHQGVVNVSAGIAQKMGILMDDETMKMHVEGRPLT